MAIIDQGWLTLAANSGNSWFIHGYGANEAVSYSIVVFPGSGPGVLNPIGHATLTQGEAFEHVDGTKAYKIYFQNNAPFNTCDVHVLARVESL